MGLTTVSIGEKFLGADPQAEAKELSSGLVIAGAYSGKIRRTLFAQLRDVVKQDKEFTKEIARASAELNVVLFNILVNELKIDKGDVVRVRINYSLDPHNRRIVWDYNSLRVEAFKRVPDEQVTRAVYDIVRNRLSHILETFRLASKAVEEAVKAFEVPEEKAEEAIGPPPIPPSPAIQPGLVKLSDIVGSADVIGETIDGGVLVKLTSREGQSIGIVTISPSGDEVLIDAIVVYGGVSRRYTARSRGRVGMFAEEPSRVVGELEKVAPVELPRDQAELLIREKMQSLL